MGLALLRERLDRSIRRTSEVEDLTGISVFGLLPKLSGTNEVPEEHVLSKPRSRFTQALRRVYVTFHLAHKSLGVKVIMITSAAAGEGKTSFCVSLARSLAANGARVLVIDVDLHRSHVASTFGCETHVHLGDVVRGLADLEDAVHIDARSGAHFVAAIPEEGDTQLLLNSVGFEAVIARARAEYDLVIVDTPPILAATDAAAVGTVTDANLLLVRWGRTPCTALLAGLRFLNLCGVVVDGIVIAQVDARHHARYGDIYDSPLHAKALARPLGPTPEALPRVRSHIGERT